MLSIHILGLLFTIASTSAILSQKHHKVRHKHNSLNLRGNHVNEIREAFDEYRSVVHKTKNQNESKHRQIKDRNASDEYDDMINDYLKFEKPSSWGATKSDGSPPLKHHAHSSSSISKPVPFSSGTSEYFYRQKRVFTSTTPTTTTTQKATTTIRSIDNYDDEYEDDDNDASNRRLNDDAEAGSMRLSRDVSSVFLFFSGNLIKVELGESSILWLLSVIMSLMRLFSSL
jgi:hypothetical protein